MRRRLCALVLLWFVAACDTAERPAAGVRLAVSDSPEIGRYLTDEAGRPLYVLVASPDGTRQCEGACSTAWPPVQTADPPLEPTEPAVQVQLIGSIVRADGLRQLTYATRPLHYRGGDAPTSLQRSTDDRWGRWSLVFPHGESMVAP
jgi:predicted lipoprotein with Yx(FWY)xxD motif